MTAWTKLRTALGTTPGVFAAVLTANALTGCTTDFAPVADTQVEGTITPGQGVIVGEVDWQDTSELAPGSAEARNADATVYLYMPRTGKRCTGFHVAPGVVMTNNHCVPDAHTAEYTKVIPNMVRGGSSADWGTMVCDELIATNPAMDMSLIRCPQTDFAPIVTLDTAHVPKGTAVYLMHQNCDYESYRGCRPNKKMSPGKALTRLRGRDGIITHDADMLRGSSGGPLFDAETHRVVGLNYAHFRPDERQRGSVNVAWSMERVIPWLKANVPSIAFRIHEDRVDCRLSTTDGVVEEDDVCASLTGPARYFRALSEGHGGGSLWTGAMAKPASNAVAWSFEVEEAGGYALSAYVVGTENASQSARYVVRVNGAATQVTMDQTAMDGWTRLTQLQLSPGSRVDVSLADETGEPASLKRRVLFDAMRLSPAVATPDPEPEPDPDPIVDPEPEPDPIVDPEPEPEPMSCAQVQVNDTVTSLNVRPTPNTDYAPLGIVSGGDVLDREDTVQGKLVRGTTDWFQIDFEGETGFISAYYATCTDA